MAKRKTIIWTVEDGDRHLAYRDEYTRGEDATDARLEDLADLCDLEAEGANAHDFVGAHRLLAVLLHRHFGRAAATSVMREIAELGGLDGMNGVACGGNAFKALGVKQPWHDWKLA